MAAKGAAYTAPVNVPYKFTMNADVRGYHKVLAVTSNSDKLKVKRIEHSAILVLVFKGVFIYLLTMYSNGKHI